MAGPVRKWFVLSLRSAMLLVLLSGLWMGWRVNRANDQRRAVAAIRRAGGGISYDYQFSVSKGYRNPNGRPWAPAWLRNWLGDEFFQEVTSVQFLNRPLTDHDLAPLASLDRLEEVAISGAPITDAGLKHLANLKELRILLALGDTRDYRRRPRTPEFPDEAANLGPLPLRVSPTPAWSTSGRWTTWRCSTSPRRGSRVRAYRTWVGCPSSRSYLRPRTAPG